jgi:hypothetical protein
MRFCVTPECDSAVSDSSDLCHRHSTLRTRIAAVIYESDGHRDQKWAKRTADAVAELIINMEYRGELQMEIDRYDDSRC